MSAEGSGPHGQWISRRDSLFSRFSLCQRHHPTKEDLPFAGWRRLEAKPLTSLHPANGKGLWPLTLIQRVFLVLVLRSVLKIRSRRIGLTPTFSRHGRAQASLALLIWPIEKVGPSTAQRIFSEWIHGKFICKREGKWSCPGLRSYRSYGSEAVGWPYEQARRLPRHFWPTPLVASLSMIFHYHLFIGEVRTIRNETTYPIHGNYPLNQVL